MQILCSFQLVDAVKGCIDYILDLLQLFTSAAYFLTVKVVLSISCVLMV